MRISGLGLVVGAAWVGLVCGPPVALLQWREARLAAVSAPEAQADWDAFRAEMRRQSDRSGPVQRKVPKSPEPPELVWLRDHVGLAITAWVALGGSLGGVLAALVLGVARGGSAAKNGAGRAGDDEKQHDGDSQHAQERRHG